MSKISDSDKLSHYDKVRRDMREEVVKRISQRDRFGIECFIAIGTLTIAATQIGWALFAAPLISLYYSTQIFESYKLHEKITSYIALVVEENIDSLLKNRDPKVQWEEWQLFSDRLREEAKENKENNDLTRKNKCDVRGARKIFFKHTMFSMILMSCAGATALVLYQGAWPEGIHHYVLYGISVSLTGVFVVWGELTWLKYKYGAKYVVKEGKVVEEYECACEKEHRKK